MNRSTETVSPTLSSHCARILACGDLAAKLAAIPGDTPDLPESGPRPPARPARNPEIAMQPGSDPLPKPRDLHDPKARARCLARFAHHELVAVELLAWALLRWPQMPPGLRGMLAFTLGEEQDHCRLYLERLRDHGECLAGHPQSDYFWRQVAGIEQSGAGPRAFLAALGLTLEQANLDFSLVYRDAFRIAGDEATAQVCQRVHDDEIGHVRAAATWLERLSGEASTDLEAYLDAVPFPLCLARAKARRFDAAARRKAGLSEEFIEAVRGARSTQESGIPAKPRKAKPANASRT